MGHFYKRVQKLSKAKSDAPRNEQRARARTHVHHETSTKATKTERRCRLARGV